MKTKHLALAIVLFGSSLGYMYYYVNSTPAPGDMWDICEKELEDVESVTYGTVVYCTGESGEKYAEPSIPMQYAQKFGMMFALFGILIGGGLIEFTILNKAMMFVIPLVKSGFNGYAELRGISKPFPELQQKSNMEGDENGA